MIAKLKINCPDMAVRNVSQGLSMTDELPCPSTLTFDDDTPPWTGIVIFPKTPVREQHDLLHWMVDPCVAFNPKTDVKITVNTPEEPTEIKFNFWPHDSQHPFVYMLAHEVMTDVTIVLPDGRTGTSKILLPDSFANWSPQEGFQTWVVGAVAMEGTVTFPDKPAGHTWLDVVFDFFRT